MTFGELLKSYSTHRALVAALSFTASVVGARLLPPEHFAILMTTAFVAKFLQITNFGAISGYFVSRYSAINSSATLNESKEPRFLLFLFLQMAGFGLMTLWVTVLWLPKYSLGVAAFLFLVPIFVVEPSLRYRRFFSFSLLPELILSSALLAVALGNSLKILPEGHSTPYLWLVACSSAISVIYALFRLKMRVRAVFEKGFGPKNYHRFLAYGAPVYLGSSLFLIASSADRLLFPLHGSDEQVGVYFLAYQLCMGAMIFLTAINFINTVNLGEARNDAVTIPTELIVKKLGIASMVGAGSYTVLLLGGLMLEYYFLPESFQGLTVVVAMLGLGLLVFFIASAVTPIVAYFGRQTPLTYGMAIVAIFLLVNNGYVYWQGLGPLWLAVGTTLGFVFYGIFAIWHTFKVIREEPKRDWSV